jgi:phosphate transport system substrate-binding protein
MSSHSAKDSNCEFEWPRGSIGAEGSANLIAAVRENRFSIGYVEYSYASETDEGGVDWGYVRNSSGKFQRARIATIRAAAKDLKGIPDDSLLQASDPGAYPIASLTWLVIPVQPRAKSRHDLCSFLDWMLDDGQQVARRLGYVELPSDIIDKERASVNEVCR